MIIIMQWKLCSALLDVVNSYYATCIFYFVLWVSGVSTFRSRIYVHNMCSRYSFDTHTSKLVSGVLEIQASTRIYVQLVECLISKMHVTVGRVLEIQDT